MVDPFDIESLSEPLETPCQFLHTGDLEALDSVALMELLSTGRSLVTVTLYDEVEGTNTPAASRERFSADGRGYAFLRPM